jgi:hypothetical protein
MTAKKKIDKEKTIQNILDKCNKSVGYYINLAKFIAKKDDEKILIECAKFVGTEVCYK